LSTQIKRQTKLSNDPFLTASFKAVATECAWMKYKRAEGQKVLSILGRRQNKTKKKCFPSSRRGVVCLGLERSQCLVTASTVFLKSSAFICYLNETVQPHSGPQNTQKHYAIYHALIINAIAYQTTYLLILLNFIFCSIFSALFIVLITVRKQENIQQVSNTGYMCATVLQNITLT
jgi:hypothetical protein